MQTYAIGDIHGHLAKLIDCHALIAADMAREGAAPVVHLGDLVDRGPDSRGVIDFLIAGQARGEDWVVLKGNHDRMFRLFLQDPPLPDPRLRAELSYLHPKIGGGATLASYGVANAQDRPVAPVHAEARAAVPAAHLDWLQACPASWSRGEAVFVHAGLRPGVALAAQSEEDLTWIREPFLEDPRDHGALVVHGHTALPAATHYGNRLNLDSSAGYGGPLSVAVIEGRRAWLLTPAGRVPVQPAPSGAARR